MVSVVRVHLPSNIPVVGCELVPYVLLRRAGNSLVSDDTTESNLIDGHFLRYKWYRMQSDKEAAVCSVHPTALAILRCCVCVKAKLPDTKSYHCSTECFSDAWHHHSVLHERASAANDTGSNASSLTSTSIPTFSNASTSLYITGAVTLRNNGEIWVEVACSKKYTPAADDVGHALKFECVVVDAARRLTVGPPSTISTSIVIQAPLPIPRQMVPVSKLDPKVYIPSAGRFSVLSYNILSDVHAKEELYSYCPKWALSWPYRRQNLLREIVGYRADIVCLQEVQNDHFDEFFAPELDKHGYQAYFKRKTAEGPAETVKNVDGCATFFRRRRFSLARIFEVEFNKYLDSLTREVTLNAWNVNALNRFNTDNVALILVLHAKSSNQGVDNEGTNRLICVTNTHINTHHQLKDVRLWQVQNLLKGLEHIVIPSGIPVLLCGDLGSVPGSAPYTLLTAGKISPLHPDLHVDRLGIHQPASKLVHELPLVSAYPSIGRVGGELGPHYKKKLDSIFEEPLFTEYSRKDIGTHDYIFYSADKLRLLSLLDLLDGNRTRKDTALPSPEWSSDHIALLAEFWCTTMTGRTV